MYNHAKHHRDLRDIKLKPRVEYRPLAIALNPRIRHTECTSPSLLLCPLLYFFVMFFLASSKRRTTSWHCVTAHSCFDLLLSSSLKKFSPAAFSTTSTRRQLRRAGLESHCRSIRGWLLCNRPMAGLHLAPASIQTCDLRAHLHPRAPDKRPITYQA